MLGRSFIYICFWEGFQIFRTYNNYSIYVREALSTNYARNEKGNSFKKAQIGRRVDMKSTLVKTSNKFEVIYGEVAGGLGQCVHRVDVVR